MLVYFTMFLMAAVGCFFQRRNLLSMLMCFEVMLLAVSLNLISASVYLGDVLGVFMAFMVLACAATETALGLSLCVVYFRHRHTIDVSFIGLMRG